MGGDILSRVRARSRTILQDHLAQFCLLALELGEAVQAIGRRLFIADLDHVRDLLRGVGRMQLVHVL